MGGDSYRSEGKGENGDVIILAEGLCCLGERKAGCLCFHQFSNSLEPKEFTLRIPCLGHAVGHEDKSVPWFEGEPCYRKANARGRTKRQCTFEREFLSVEIGW